MFIVCVGILSLGETFDQFFSPFFTQTINKSENYVPGFFYNNYN